MDYTLDQEVVFETSLEAALELTKTMCLAAAMPLVQLHVALRKTFEIRDSQTGERVLAFEMTPQGLGFVGEEWLTHHVLPDICNTLGKIVCVLEIRPDLIEPMKQIYVPKPPAPF